MSRRLALPALFTVFSLIILIGLGTWQWRRMGEKEALVATITSRATLAPQPIPGDWSKVDLNALSYLPVTATGTFDNGHEAHVFFSLAKPVAGVSGPGYLIVTPFTLADGRVVLVNRGFVPVQNKDAATRAAGQLQGPQTITGLIRQPEARATFSGTDDPGKNVYFVRDPGALAKALGIGAVAPFMIDLKAPTPAGGLPVPGVTQIDIPNNHFQYALTWWSLAAVLAAIFIVFARQRDANGAN